MKRICLILLLTLTGSAYAFGAGPKDEILAAEKRWAEAVIALDFAALEKIYHDGLIYAHSTGTIETNGEYLGKLRSGKQKWEFRVLSGAGRGSQVRLIGRFAPATPRFYRFPAGMDSSPSAQVQLLP